MATLNPGSEPYQDSLLSYLDEWVRDVGPQNLVVSARTTKQAGKNNDELGKEDLPQSATARELQDSTGSMGPIAKLKPTKAAYFSSAPFDKDATVIIDLCEEISGQEMPQPANSPKPQPLPGANTISRGKSTDSTHSTAKFDGLHGRTDITATRQYFSEVPPASNIGIGIKHEKVVPKAALGTQKEESLNSWGLPVKMPLQLLDQVHEWNDHNPRQTPPFATMYNPNSPLHETPAGVGASFWHESGKKLKVGWYDLPKRLYPQSTNHGTCLRLLVAYHGPLGPCFCRYASPGKPTWSKERATAYKAWIGFDGLNKNGFEFKPSIFKIANTSTKDGNAASSLSTSKTGVNFEPLHELSRTNGKLPIRSTELASRRSIMRCQPESSARVDNASESSNALLQSFMMPVSANDKQKATLRIDKQNFHLQSSSGLGERVKRRASTDEALEPPKKIYRPSTQLSTKAEKEVDPWSLRRLFGFPPGRPWSTRPRSAIGNPDLNFTIMPSKLCDLPSNTEQPGQIFHRSTANGGEQIKPRVPSIEEVTQQQGLKVYGMTSAVTGGPSEITEQSSLNAEATKDYAEIDAHMRENTAVLFYADSSYSPCPPTRHRMIGACNNSSKLFAQASAGSVFPSSYVAGKTRVLSLRLNNQVELIPVVEEDGEDFEAFIMKLRQASCWSRDDTGKLTGSCTVEIRAKL